MTPLKRIVMDMIRDSGPMDLARYMALALGHPQHGYYMTRDRFGQNGDFITAPEISQMFGEMLAIYLIDSWHRRGAASSVVLVELGPGRGTLMADMLRVARREPAFWAAVRGVHLVETSPALRAIQARTLGGEAITFHDTLDSVPTDAQWLVAANEFFDALPIRQLIRRDGRWHERCVGVNAAGDDLIWGLVPTDFNPGRPTDDDDVIEQHPVALAVARTLFDRVGRTGGAGVIVDYGYGGDTGRAGYPTGDTLQALRAHEPCDPLMEPGECDITAHVDFDALAQLAKDQNLVGMGPIPQGQFLQSLGITLRAERLKAANPAESDAVQAALNRLIDAGQMGTLFKVLCVESPHT